MRQEIALFCKYRITLSEMSVHAFRFPSIISRTQPTQFRSCMPTCSKMQPTNGSTLLCALLLSLTSSLRVFACVCACARVCACVRFCVCDRVHFFCVYVCVCVIVGMRARIRTCTRAHERACQCGHTYVRENNYNKDPIMSNVS